MSRFIRALVWLNFLSAAYHTIDTALGIHHPVFPPMIDFALHSFGLYFWGTIALYVVGIGDEPDPSVIR